MRRFGPISGAGLVEISEIDVLIVGGGMSGAALAGLIARNRAVRVVLLEAAPRTDHDLEGLFVCDASIFSAIMRAYTKPPAVILAEHMALGDSSAGAVI